MQQRWIDSSRALCRICSMFSSCLLADSSCFCTILFCSSCVEASCCACSATSRSSRSLRFSLACSWRSSSFFCLLWSIRSFRCLLSFSKRSSRSCRSLSMARRRSSTAASLAAFSSCFFLRSSWMPWMRPRCSWHNSRKSCLKEG